MKKTAVTTVILSALMLAPVCASAQYKDNKAAEETPKTKTDLLLEGAKAVLHALLHPASGSVIRVKGTLSACGGGVFRLNGTPGCESVRYEEEESRAAFNVIGRNLNRACLRAALEEAYEQQ